MIPDPVWRQRIVFVTGCSGFLGSWLVRRLCENGARVIGFCRSEMPRSGLFSEFGLRDRIKFVQGSLADQALLERTIRESGADTIFHLAAQSKVDIARRYPSQTFETNIQGTWNLLEAVRNAGQIIRVVVASSDIVYESSRELPYTETSPMEGMSPYAASKACAELLAKSYHRFYGVRVCIARTSNLYGGGDLAFQRIIPGTIRSVIRGEAPVINSNGHSERDFLYVEDAVAGYLLLAAAMERAQICGEAFNFSAETPITVSVLVETILKLMERWDLNPQVLGQCADEIAIKHSPSLRAREELGWCADWSLESALKKTIAWYRAHAYGLHLEAQN